MFVITTSSVEILLKRSKGNKSLKKYSEIRFIFIKKGNLLVKIYKIIDDNNVVVVWKENERMRQKRAEKDHLILNSILFIRIIGVIIEKMITFKHIFYVFLCSLITNAIYEQYIHRKELYENCQINNLIAYSGFFSQFQAKPNCKPYSITQVDNKIN